MRKIVLIKPDTTGSPLDEVAYSTPHGSSPSASRLRSQNGGATCHAQDTLRQHERASHVRYSASGPSWL